MKVAAPCWLCKLVPPFFATCLICGKTDPPGRGVSR